MPPPPPTLKPNSANTKKASKESERDQSYGRCAGEIREERERKRAEQHNNNRLSIFIGVCCAQLPHTSATPLKLTEQVTQRIRSDGRDSIDT